MINSLNLKSLLAVIAVVSQFHYPSFTLRSRKRINLQVVLHINYLIE